MDWQQLVSLAIVGGAAALLLWRKVRPRKFSFARDTHCGCSASQRAVPQHSIVFHARKGERPQVRVKMK
jgi:ABC-type nickel/cobalt efflux system permease component RcnA